MSTIVCIRCGSKDHTTREHDEKNLGKGKKAATAAAKNAAASPKTAGSPQALQRAKQDHCWRSPRKNDGIPDVIEAPLRPGVYHDPPAEDWQRRRECPCQECDRKRKKRSIDMGRRFGHLPH